MKDRVIKYFSIDPQKILPLIGWYVFAFVVFKILLLSNLDAGLVIAASPLIGILLPLQIHLKLSYGILLLVACVFNGMVAGNPSLFAIIQGALVVTEVFVMVAWLGPRLASRKSYLEKRLIMSMTAGVFGVLNGILYQSFSQLWQGDIFYYYGSFFLIHSLAIITVAPFFSKLIESSSNGELGKYLRLPVDVVAVNLGLLALLFYPHAGIHYIFIVFFGSAYCAYRCEKEKLFLLNFLFLIAIALHPDSQWGAFVGQNTSRILFAGCILVITVSLVSIVFYEVQSVGLPKNAMLSIVAVVALIFAFSLQIYNNEEQKYEDNIDRRISDINQDILRKYRHYSMIVNSVKAYVEASEEVTEEEWLRFSSTLDLKNTSAGIKDLFIVAEVEAGNYEIQLGSVMENKEYARRQRLSQAKLDVLQSAMPGMALVAVPENHLFYLYKPLTSSHKYPGYVVLVADLEVIMNAILQSSRYEVLVDFYSLNQGSERLPGAKLYSAESTYSKSLNGYTRTLTLDFKSFKMLGYYSPSTNFSQGSFELFWITSVVFSLVAILLAKALIANLSAEQVAKRLVEDLSAKLFHSSKQAAIGEMAGGIAHEINNPLTIVMGRVAKLKADLMKGNIAPGVITEELAKVETSAKRMAKIISGIKALGTNSKGEPLMPISVDQIVATCTDICSERFSKNGIEFIVSNQSKSHFLGRVEQVDQVIINLLNNAHDAVIGQSEKPWVRLTIVDLDSHVEFAVSDSGSGIPSHIREKLFEPFFTTKGAGKGTGIGLSISKRIIDDHGGVFDYDSNSPNTRFYFRLKKTSSEGEIFKDYKKVS